MPFLQIEVRCEHDCGTFRHRTIYGGIRRYTKQIAGQPKKIVQLCLCLSSQIVRDDEIACRGEVEQRTLEASNARHK